MLTLGVDTSCDDTSLALFDGNRVIANFSSSQDQFHARFGGVVPEISARKHLETILPLLVHTLNESGVQMGDIKLLAATKGPGLIGGLLVGATFANIASGSLRIPVTGVHHLEGHIFSPWLLSGRPLERHIALIISGGHTRLVAVESEFRYSEIGSTRDDAAGELIDKTGRLLGFPYPGGRAMDEAAMACDLEPVDFPRPLISSDDFDFSFSGLKTAVLYFLKDAADTAISTGAVAKGVMTSLASVLAVKSFRACTEMGFDVLAVSGGVSASRFIRDFLTTAGADCGIDVRFPGFEYTTDNAAMIASAGHARFIAGLVTGEPIDCKAALPLA